MMGCMETSNIERRTLNIGSGTLLPSSATLELARQSFTGNLLRQCDNETPY